MNINEIYNSVQTVGAFVIYKDKFAFMIGPNKERNRLGIVRFGGHVELGESISECLHREMLEEISTTVKIVNSPVTYYKESWEETLITELNQSFPSEHQPIAVVGDSIRSTALFLSYADSELRPSSETHGIILLSKDEVKKVCTNRFTLKEFLKDSGELVEGKKIDYDMEILAGPHLKFLYFLIENNNKLIDKYIRRNL
jgi:ADP-ribose pyrophosphatase YjhB (NUDIX family)